MNELPYLVFAGSASQNLAEKICDSLGCPLGKMRTEHFADGEFAVFYEESIRGKDIFLVQSTYPNADNTYPWRTSASLPLTWVVRSVRIAMLATLGYLW